MPNKSHIIRNFHRDDLPMITGLFNKLSGTENTLKAYDESSMSELLSLPPCIPENDCFVALSGESIIGFAIVYRELKINRTVTNIGVNKDYRKSGIEQDLLQVVIDYARSNKSSVLHVQVPTEADDTRQMLLSMDFTKVKQYWAMQHRKGSPTGMSMPEGFTLRSFKIGTDESSLTKIQNAAFNDHWGFCPNTEEDIAAKVRFSRSFPDGIIFAMKDERITAYNWTMRTPTGKGSTGWIAMTGVHPNYRGVGLGKAIASSGVTHLYATGMSTIELEVDSENTKAINIYQSLGFEKLTENVWYELKISAPNK